MTPEQIRTAACEAYDIAARGCIADEKHATGVEAVFRAGMVTGRAEAQAGPRCEFAGIKRGCQECGLGPCKEAK